MNSKEIISRKRWLTAISILSIMVFGSFKSAAGSYSSEMSSSCPRSCPKLSSPVCGSDGVIYANDCEMRRRTCNRVTNDK